MNSEHRKLAIAAGIKAISLPHDSDTAAIRRRIEDWLRKYADKDDLLFIGGYAGVKLLSTSAHVCSSGCSMCRD